MKDMTSNDKVYFSVNNYPETGEKKCNKRKESSILNLKFYFIRWVDVYVFETEKYVLRFKSTVPFPNKSISSPARGNSDNLL